MGAGQAQAVQGLGEEKGALFPRLHQPVVPALPDHAQGNARQARAGTQVPAQRLGGQGQAVKKGRQMKAVAHQIGEGLAPVARAHQIHDAVPTEQAFQIGGQRRQRPVRNVQTGLTRAGGQIVRRRSRSGRDGRGRLPGRRPGGVTGAIRGAARGKAFLHVVLISPSGGTCKPGPDNVKKTHFTYFCGKRMPLAGQARGVAPWRPPRRGATTRFGSAGKPARQAGRAGTSDSD